MRQICIFLAYQQIEIIKTSFESLKQMDVDFFIIENNSENSDEIKEYFLQQNLVGYIQFHENAAAQAVTIFMKDYFDFISNYDYITYTDGDFYLHNPKETMSEIINAFNNSGCLISSCALFMGNDYSSKYRIIGLDNYNKVMEDSTLPFGNIVGQTGGSLITVKRENLSLFTSFHFIDSYLWGRVRDAGGLWFRTTKNLAYHLTWDLYQDGNPYYIWKQQVYPTIWLESNKIFKYTVIKSPSFLSDKMKHTKESLELTKYISERIGNQTFHHHYHVLYDIAQVFGDKIINYVEIGCYAGGSACLMLQRPNTNVISIDIGTPITPQIVKENVKNLNILNNKYSYIQGNSQKSETVDFLKHMIQSIDMLFIDGCHEYSCVINDFNLYSKMVRPEGYIIFDDYNDSQYSPQVKVAVDDLLTNNYEYEILGTLPNIFGARPSELKDGNCFIIKKK